MPIDLDLPEGINQDALAGAADDYEYLRKYMAGAEGKSLEPQALATLVLAAELSKVEHMLYNLTRVLNERA